MRSRETTTKPVRSAPKRRTRVDGSGNGGRMLTREQRERPAARQHTTFRRVAVFVPLDTPETPYNR